MSVVGCCQASCVAHLAPTLRLLRQGHGQPPLLARELGTAVARAQGPLHHTIHGISGTNTRLILPHDRRSIFTKFSTQVTVLRDICHWVNLVTIMGVSEQALEFLGPFPSLLLLCPCSHPPPRRHLHLHFSDHSFSIFTLGELNSQFLA